MTRADKVAILGRLPCDFLSGNIFQERYIMVSFNSSSGLMTESGWGHYSKLDYWEPMEAVELLFGFLPHQESWSHQNIKSTTLHSIMEQCTRACQMGNLKHEVIHCSKVKIDDYLGFGFDYFVINSHDSSTSSSLKVFKPSVFFAWAGSLWLSPWRMKDTDEQAVVDAPTNASPTLNKSDAKELERLRKEKENWDESLRAAVHIGVWLTGLEYKPSRGNNGNLDNSLKGFMQKEFPQIEGKTMNNRLWRAIPDDMKNNGGNPKQPMREGL